jgi:NO-binding membrane sensor protein with MHYT domain
MGGFLVWQPIGYWFVHLLPPRAHAIVTQHDWVVFELEVAVVGAIAGLWWYCTRRATPRTRVQYWADSGISILGLGLLLNADQSTTMPWFLWIPMLVVIAAIIGVVFGSVALFVANSIDASRAGRRTIE